MLCPNSIHAEPKAGPGHGGDGHPRSCMITGPSHHTLPQVQGPIYLPAPHTAWLNVEAHKHLLNEQMSKWMNGWMNCLFLHLWLVETALFTLGTIPSCCFFESFPLCFVTLQCTTTLTPYIQIQPEILVLGNKHKNILKNTPTLGQLKSTHRGMAGMYVAGNWCLFMHPQCKWFITWFILRSFWLNSIFHDILSHRNSPFTQIFWTPALTSFTDLASL